MDPSLEDISEIGKIGSGGYGTVYEVREQNCS